MRGSGPVLLNIAAAAMPILTLPVIARLYVPDIYGGYTAFLAAATLVCFLGTLRLDIAFVAERDGRLAGVLATTAAFAIMAAALLWSLAPAAAGPTRFGVSQGVAAVFVILLGAMVLAQSMLLKAGATVALATLNLGFQALFFAGAVVFSLFPAPLTGNGVIDGRLLALFAALGLFLLLAVRLGLAVPRPDISLAGEALGRHKDTLRFTYPYTIVGMLSADMILFALILRGDTALAGAYGLVRTVLLAAGSVFGAAVSPLYFRFALEAEADAVADATRRLAMALGPAGFFIFGVAAGAAPALIGLAFGPSWSAAADLVVLFAYPFAWTLLTGWPERIFEVRRQQARGFLLHALWAATSALAIIAAHSAGGGDWLLAAGFAAATALFQIAYAATAFRLAGLPAAWFLRLLLTGLVAFVAGYGVSMFGGRAFGGAAHVAFAITLVGIAAAVAARPLLAALDALGATNGRTPKASTE